MTLTQAQQEAIYDAQRSGRAYIKPEPLSAQEEEILTLLLEISPPDPDELPSPPALLTIIEALEAAELPPTMPAHPSPLLVDLLGWAEKESAEYAASFKRGFADGQAIARALRAEEQGADIDTIIKQLEDAGL